MNNRITLHILKKNGVIMITWQPGIRKCGYKLETSMNNLITMIFAYYEEEISSHVSDYDTESGNFDGTYIEACKAYVVDNGGFK